MVLRHRRGGWLLVGTALFGASACVVPPPPPNLGSISGVVRSMHTGTGVVGVEVAVFRASDASLVATGVSGSDGTFSVANLTAGDYKVRYLGAGWVTEYFDDKTTLAAAAVVLVNDGATSVASAELRDTGVGAACNTADMVPGHDFTGADLHNCDFGDRNLSNVIFRNANLSGAKLKKTNFLTSHARLTGAVITGANFHNASLEGRQLFDTNADWTNTDLSGTHVAFISTVTTTIVHNFAAAGARLVGTNLEDTAFFGNNLNGVDMTGANLSKSSFSATVVGTTFTGARITGAEVSAVLSRAQLLSTNRDWTGTNLPYGADLSNLDLPAEGFALRGISMSGCKLTDSSAAGMDFTGADLSACVMTRANLSAANLTAVDLSNADFRTANLTAATIRGADLSQAVRLTGPQLLSTVPDWRSVDFSQSFIDLTGADLDARDVLLQGAILSGLDLTGARLGGVPLDGADISAGRLSNAVGLTRSQLLSASHDWESIKLDGTGVDLSNIDFVAGAFSVRAARFEGLNLSGANFRGMSVNSASFSRANLQGAIFVESNVYNAEFYRADVTGANFYDADLSFARFASATGIPAGGATAIFDHTTCPDTLTTHVSQIEGGSTFDSCLGHGFDP